MPIDLLTLVPVEADDEDALLAVLTQAEHAGWIETFEDGELARPVIELYGVEVQVNREYRQELLAAALEVGYEPVEAE